MSQAGISTIAVLAGGLATRMRPMTQTIPKALIPVAGEPFIAHQLRLFRREGLTRVVLCVGYLGELVADFVGDGSRFGLQVTCCFDGERLLGTGGALRKALPQLGDRFFVIYGDSYLDLAYEPVSTHFLQSGKRGLMTVFRNEGRWDTSNVVFDGKSVLEYSKSVRRPDMQYIDYGLGILTAATLLQYDEAAALDLATVYGALVADGQLAGYEATHRFYEIGSPAGLADTEAYIARTRRGAGQTETGTA